MKRGEHLDHHPLDLLRTEHSGFDRRGGLDGHVQQWIFEGCSGLSPMTIPKISPVSVRQFVTTPEPDHWACDVPVPNPGLFAS